MENKRYYNASERRWYNAGRGITRRIDAHTIFSGVPSEEQLQEWGYELYVEQEQNESNEDLAMVESEQ